MQISFEVESGNQYFWNVLSGFGTKSALKSLGCGPPIGSFPSSILLLEADSLLIVKSKNMQLWQTEKHFYVVWYPLVMTYNLGVSLDLHRIFKYLLECDSSDGVCFSLSDKSSLEVWRHCHCYSNSGNATSEADSVKIVATFKYYLLSCFDTHTVLSLLVLQQYTLYIFLYISWVVWPAHLLVQHAPDIYQGCMSTSCYFWSEKPFCCIPDKAREQAVFSSLGAPSLPPLGCMWSSLAEVISTQLREQEFIAACYGLATSAGRLHGTRSKA